MSDDDHSTKQIKAYCHISKHTRLCLFLISRRTLSVSQIATVSVPTETLRIATVLVCVQSWTTTPRLVTRCVSHRGSAPWLTDEVREARRRRRQAERRWRSTHLTVHREIFVKERATVKRCIRDTGKLHYSSKIDTCSTTKQLFAVSDELLGKAKTTSLPSNIPIADLPQRFCDFYVTKIKQIREDLDSCPHDPTVRF